MEFTRIDGPERNLPPDDFQERLAFVGGVNRYDEPNFRLAWAQTETYVAGGIWSVDEQYFRGYRRLLAGSGEPCWSLLQWHAPEEYGSPEAYYVTNFDEASGLQILGEYPYSGRVEILYNLRWHEMVNNRLEFHTLPLNNYLLNVLVPMIRMAEGISLEKRRAAWLDARARGEEERLAAIERHLRDNTQPYTGAVSYARQGIRSTAIDQRALELQRYWNQISENARRFRIGLQTE